MRRSGGRAVAVTVTDAEGERRVAAEAPRYRGFLTVALVVPEEARRPPWRGWKRRRRR